MADKKYCIYCGSENDASNEMCAQCHKELHPKENLLKEFLVERVKDELKGNLEDTLYDAIKNFLLSHLYGAVVTVSVVSYAVAATGVEILNEQRTKHIIPVNQPIMRYEEIIDLEDDINENSEVIVETEEVVNFVEEYVGLYANYDENKEKIISMEASSASYGKNISFVSSVVNNFNGSGEVLCESPKINGSPIGKIASNLKKNNKEYAQVFVTLFNESGFATGYYLVTLVDDSGTWYVVETVNAIGMVVDASEQGALDRLGLYRSIAKFADYETYTNAEYQEFISNRLPSVYGYHTSYEFKIDRFLPQANGCLDYRITSSGMSPANSISNIGATLRSNNIKFVEFTLSEDIYGSEGYMGTQSWLIVVGYFDSIWYVVEDRYLGVSQIENPIEF